MGRSRQQVGLRRALYSRDPHRSLRRLRELAVRRQTLRSLDRSNMVFCFTMPQVHASTALPADMELGIASGDVIGLREFVGTPEIATGPVVTFEGSVFAVKRFGR